MGVFTIDYGNKGQKIIDAFKSAYNYQEEVDDGNGNMIPNPTSEADFTKNIIIGFIRQIVVQHNTAVQDAKAAHQAAIDAEQADAETLSIS